MATLTRAPVPAPADSLYPSAATIVPTRPSGTAVAPFATFSPIISDPFPSTPAAFAAAFTTGSGHRKPIAPALSAVVPAAGDPSAPCLAHLLPSSAPCLSRRRRVAVVRLQPLESLNEFRNESRNEFLNKFHRRG